MKNIMAIIKKEFTRFFKDKRLVFTTILLPGLMIYFIYSFMGQGMSGMFDPNPDYKASVYLYNMPASLAQTVDSLNIELMPTEDFTEEQIKQKINKKQADLMVIFPQDFDDLVANYDVSDPIQTAPHVEIFFNSTSTEGQAIYSVFIALLNNYESSIANKFDINSGTDTYDLASQQDMAAQLFGSLLPFLLLIFIFSGCMSVAPESIAGEKERGTISTLLITPMKRSELAIGKIVSLGVISLLSGLSSFLGVILSLPKLMGGEMEGISGSVYMASDYLLLLGVILSTVLFAVAAISIISAFAKSVKEATALITPLMIVAMVAGISSMFTSGAVQGILPYLIPLYNSVQAMNGIFWFQANVLSVIITVASNLVYTGIFIFALTKMFNSEKIMFSK